ncbi:MAG: hypothetical protein RL114_1559 [Actinomycetota bacterium]|jgi:hypothetical protein
MKFFKYLLKCVVSIISLVGVDLISPMEVGAKSPVVETDQGAFVRIVGNPADGTIKFQYGWSAESPASDAAGYWVGVYDVSNSTYLWSSDTGATELPDQMFRNAKPTTDLPEGEYKVVFFVRETYEGPVSNIAEIELPFVVNDSMM